MSETSKTSKTSKHYAAAAALFRDHLASANGERAIALRAFAWGLADVFAAANPAFDRARFLAACEPTKPAMKLHTVLAVVALVAALFYACLVEAAPRSPKYRFWWDRPQVVAVPKGAMLYWRADCMAMVMDFAPEKQPQPGWAPFLPHCARI